jgi:hypothetical protein
MKCVNFGAIISLRRREMNLIKKVVVVSALMVCGSTASAQLPGGGLGGVPLIGADLASLSSPEGLLAGVSGLVENQSLPVAFPVVGRTPIKSYAPVVLTLVYTVDPTGGQLRNSGLGLPAVPALPSLP